MFAKLRARLEASKARGRKRGLPKNVLLNSLRQLHFEPLEARALLTVDLFLDPTGNGFGNAGHLIGNFIRATTDEANDFDFIPRLGTSFYTFHNPAGATGDLNVRLAA